MVQTKFSVKSECQVMLPQIKLSSDKGEKKHFNYFLRNILIINLFSKQKKYYIVLTQSLHNSLIDFLNILVKYMELIWQGQF